MNAHSEFELLHHKCGRTFKSKWCNIYRNPSEKEKNRHGTRCPFCNANQLESSHALVLKQVWQHEKIGTIIEDKSCINPHTNHPLPTDIVNHDEKIAIEIQSWFHDFEDQKIKDKIKKEYWLNRGYKFYAIDQRDYTILEMIQIFFPYISSIPEYIDFGYSNKINDVMIQDLLNKGYKIPEVAKMVNCKQHQIYDAMQYNRITYPKNYINACYTPIIKFSLDGQYLCSYDSISEAARSESVKPANISACIGHKRYRSSGFIWIPQTLYNQPTFNILNHIKK